jgi:hypothetical protein
MSDPAMTDPAMVGPVRIESEPPTWFASWILLAVIGVVIFIVGVTLGAVSRHTATVRTTTTATATVTVAAGPEIATVGPTGALLTQFGDGLYQVGVDIEAGNYHTDGGKDCYWERLSNLSGGFTGIISNGEPTGPTTVRVLASDKAFSVHGGCSWAEVS